jgi:hypothetical protein
VEIQITALELNTLGCALRGGKFVLISTTRHYFYGDKIWSPDDKCGINALFIQKRNGFWERVGIAVFTWKAWNSANPKEEYVQLV